MGERARPFTSHVKMMSLTLTLPHAGRWFYQREIQLITGIAYTPVRAALISLEEFGLLRKRTHGNRQYYTIDKEFFLYEEYRSIVFKTTGLGDHLRWVSRNHPDQLRLAFICGDFAEGTETTDTPVRFLAVGDIARAKLDAALRPASKLTQKKFEYLLLTPRDLAARRRRKDPELEKALGGKKIFVVGRPQTLEALTHEIA